MIPAPTRAASILAAAGCALSLAGSSCGDNAAGFDGGPPIDARHIDDASVVSCGGDLDAGASCDGDDRRKVCDVDRGLCVECLETDDCGGGDALGPSCNRESGTCVCAGDDSCDGNPNGPFCDSIVRACTCLLDRDCDEPATCELEPYLGAGVRTCRDRGRRGRRAPGKKQPRSIHATGGRTAGLAKE